MGQHGKQGEGSRVRGQSTLEYILVLAAILVAVIAGAAAFMNPAAKKTITDSEATITAAAAKLAEKVK